MIELIKYAIKFNLANRECEYTQKEVEFNLGSIVYARDCKTLHLNVGRRSGKTFAMMTLARKGDLIIVHTEQTKRQLKHDYPNCLATINTLHDIKPEYGRGRNWRIPLRIFDYVWIDEPALCGTPKDVDIDAIYEYTMANLYVKLGG